MLPANGGGQEDVGSIERATKGSCIITGLFIEGARWDDESRRLVEATPKIFQEPLPPILLEAIAVDSAASSQEQDEAGADGSPFIYPCPVYRTQLRAGEILPTGHSTNYIFQLDLPTDHPPQHWIRRGVSAILELCEI